MRKSLKKLALSRETLQSLAESALPHVVGRDTGVSGCLMCPPPSDLPPC
jgi:hypothetical protein